MIAALFVDSRGCYAGLPDVDCWDESRDARLYAGPHPVVAHPPCSRWCRLAGLVEARWHGVTVGKGKRRRVAQCKRGDDGGCFASALASIRRWGGVLEHPAYSDAWAAHDLNAPPTGGGWVNADMLGGWTCYVEQSRYGHLAKKATWLYALGIELPSLRWGFVADRDCQSVGLAEWRDCETRRARAPVSWCGNHTAADEDRPRVGKRAAAATPPEFRDVLIAMARTAGPLPEPREE